MKSGDHFEYAPRKGEGYAFTDFSINFTALLIVTLLFDTMLFPAQKVFGQSS